MYALIHNSQLLLGPIQFNSRMMTSVLEDELELDYQVQPRQYQEVPICIDENTYILPAVINIPSHDGRTHLIGNYNWEINYENEIPISVTFTYPLIEKPLDQVKAERKTEVTPVRREKENTLIDVNIGDTMVKVSTSREQRLAFVSKLVSSSGPHNFKFGNNVWTQIDNTTLQNILSQVDVKVQEAFDWELSKLQEIDSCTTVEQVLNVVVREQPQRPERTQRQRRQQQTEE